MQIKSESTFSDIYDCMYIFFFEGAETLLISSSCAIALFFMINMLNSYLYMRCGLLRCCLSWISIVALISRHKYEKFSKDEMC